MNLVKTSKTLNDHHKVFVVTIPTFAILTTCSVCSLSQKCSLTGFFLKRCVTLIQRRVAAKLWLQGCIDNVRTKWYRYMPRIALNWVHSDLNKCHEVFPHRYGWLAHRLWSDLPIVTIIKCPLRFTPQGEALIVISQINPNTNANSKVRNRSLTFQLSETLRCVYQDWAFIWLQAFLYISFG